MRSFCDIDRATLFRIEVAVIRKIRWKLQSSACRPWSGFWTLTLWPADAVAFSHWLLHTLLWGSPAIKLSSTVLWLCIWRFYCLNFQCLFLCYGNQFLATWILIKQVPNYFFFKSYVCNHCIELKKKWKQTKKNCLVIFQMLTNLLLHWSHFVKPEINECEIFFLLSSVL